MLCSIIFIVFALGTIGLWKCDCGFDMQNTLQSKSILTMLQFEGSYSLPYCRGPRMETWVGHRLRVILHFSIKPYT